MTRLRRLYNRIRLDEMELSILRGVLTSIQNFIYRNNGRGIDCPLLFISCLSIRPKVEKLSGSMRSGLCQAAVKLFVGAEFNIVDIVAKWMFQRILESRINNTMTEEIMADETTP